MCCRRDTAQVLQRAPHPVEVQAELAQLLLVERLNAVQRVLRQRGGALQRRQALVRLQACTGQAPLIAPA